MPIINTFNPSTAVNVGTDEITVSSHNFLPEQGVIYYNGGGTSIGGLVNGFKYYIIYINANTVKLATSEDDARNNISVDLLSVGSGSAHNLTESNIYPNSAAYYDFFRKVRLIGDGLPIEGVQLEAKSVRDTFTIIGGNNINFECDDVDIAEAQFTINAPNYQLKFNTGTSDLRLFNDAGFDQSVTFKAGTGVSIAYNSPEEIEITSFGVTETDTIQSVTSRGNITNNRIVMNDVTVAEIVSTPGVDGVTTSACTTTNTTSDSITGDGTLDTPVRFSNFVNSSSELNETVTVTFTVPNPGTLSYAANYISESAVLTTGTVYLEREDPANPGTWVPLDSVSGTLARNGYSIDGIYAELNPGTTNYRIIWDWTGNSSFVRLSFNIYFEVEPIEGYEMIFTDTADKELILGVDDGLVTVRGPSVFTGYIDTQGLRIYQNNIVGTNSNDDIVIDLNGTGDLELRADTFKTNETTFNIIDTVATTVNAFGAATTINVGADSGTLTIGNPTVVGTQTTQNLYDTVATTVNAFGAATTIDIGATSGTITVNNPTLVGTQTTQNVYNTVATTVNAFGAATTIELGAATGTTNVNNNLVVDLDLEVKGGDITTDQTTFNLLNTSATTVNAFGAATTIELGAATGTTNVNNNLVVDLDLEVKGGDITTDQTTFNLLNTTAATVNFAGAGTLIEIGAISGTTTVNNNLVVELDLEVNGGDITTTQTSFNLLNANATTINAFGAATTINFGSLIFTGNTVDTNDSSGITFIPAVLFDSNIRANDVRVDQDLIVTRDSNLNRNLVVQGTTLVQALTAQSDVTLNQSLTVQGNTTLNQNLVVQGDLTVNGTTTTLNTSTLEVEDLNITVAKGATNAAAADGAGLSVDGASASLTYASADNSWNFNKILKASSLEDTPIGVTTRAAGSFTTLNANGDVTLGDTTADNLTIGGKFINGTVFRTDTTAGNTLSLAAYDTDTGPGWTNLITLTSGATPTLSLTSTGTGSINNMSIGSSTPSTGKFTTLEVRDTTTTNFDLFFASNSSVALTEDRTLTFDVENASRTVTLNGNIDIGGNLTTANSFTTSGNFALTLTATAATNVTLPTSGTLATTGNLSQFAATTSAQLAGVISDETGSGALVFGTSPTIATPDITLKNDAVTGDGNYSFDAATTTVASWQANFTNNRSLIISNLTAGRMVTIYIRNSNTSARTIAVTASATASGHAAVNLAPGGGGVSVTSVSLSASGGTAVVTVFNANGNFVGGIV